jgi:hypothetical protein
MIAANSTHGMDDGSRGGGAVGGEWRDGRPWQ